MREFGIRLTDPNPLSVADVVPGSFSCRIGPDMMGITRVSPSFAGVFRPKKDWRKFECDRLSVCSLLAADGLLAIGKMDDGDGLGIDMEESTDTIDSRLRLALDCLYVSYRSYASSSLRELSLLSDSGIPGSSFEAVDDCL